MGTLEKIKWRGTKKSIGQRSGNIGRKYGAIAKKELELLKKHTLGDLSEEQFLEIIKNLVAKFLKKNGEEAREFLHRIIIKALPR